LEGGRDGGECSRGGRRENPAKNEQENLRRKLRHRSKKHLLSSEKMRISIAPREIKERETWHQVGGEGLGHKSGLGQAFYNDRVSLYFLIHKIACIKFQKEGRKQMAGKTHKIENDI